MHRRDFLALTSAVPAFAKIPVREASPVETVFKSPGPKPNGLQATDDGLWILDQGDNRAYLVDYKDGKVIRALDTESKAGSGITFDGKALWLASTYSREIIQCDAQTGKTIAKHNTPGAGVVHWVNGRTSPLAGRAGSPPGTLGSARTPPIRPGTTTPRPQNATGAHGLEWREGKLWIAVPPAKKIYMMEPVEWKVLKEFPTVGDRPHGLGWRGAELWCVDSNLNEFHQYNPSDGTHLATIRLRNSDPLPHGMTIRGNTMWYCDDVGVVCRLKMPA